MKKPHLWNIPPKNPIRIRDLSINEREHLAQMLIDAVTEAVPLLLVTDPDTKESEDQS